MDLTLSLTRRLTTALLSLSLLGAFSPPGASASTLPWTVDGTFASGSPLTGNFEFDATSGVAYNWNLTGLGFTYTTANSTFSSGQCCSDHFDFNFSTEGNILTLDFAFNPDLTNAGGTSKIAGGAVTFYVSPDRPPVVENLVSGSAVSGTVPVGVPEPGSSLLVVCGGLLFVILAILRSLAAGQKQSPAAQSIGQAL